MLLAGALTPEAYHLRRGHRPHPPPLRLLRLGTVGQALPLLDLVYARQLTLHGMRGLDAARFGSLLDLVDAGRFDPGALVTRRIPLSEVGAALADMDDAPSSGITVVDRACG